MADSLIERDQRQLTLSSEMADHLFAVEEAGDEWGTPPDYTAERLWKSYPEKYRMIVALSAEGIGVLRIGRLLKCGPATIQAVQDREGGQIEILRARLAGLARRGVQLCIEGLVEMLSDESKRKRIPARDMAIIAGILNQNAELLSGGATSRLEVVDRSAPTHEDFLHWIDSLPQVTGAEVRTAGQKEPAANAAGPGSDGPGASAPAVVEDEGRTA